MRNLHPSACGLRAASLVGLLMLLAMAHGLAYAMITPVWQAPDEPMLYEYAALVAQLGRVPDVSDRSPALEARILASLEREEFWRHTLGATPDPAPTSLAAASGAFFMPRQVGGDPPLYFLLAGAALRLVPGWLPEQQVRLLRVLNALLLPLAVLCVYLATRELLAPASLLCLLPATLVALQPMAAYSGAMLSNDGLANLVGAGGCWLLLRALRGGPDPGWLVGLLLLAALGLLVKRTILPYAAVGMALAVVWLLGTARFSRRRGLVAGAVLASALIARIWLAGQIDPGAAAGWLDARSELPSARVATTDGAALLLRAGDEALQPLPALGTAMLRNGALTFGARVWSDSSASGRLIVYTGARRQELPFAVAGGQVRIGAYVPTIATDVRLGIVADSGWFYADDLWARGVGIPGQLLANGDLGVPALRPGAPLAYAVRYLRLDELAWSLRSGRLVSGLELGTWARWLFASFWAQPGWLDIVVVRGTPWEPVLALACAAGLAGALRAMLHSPRPPGLRRGLLALLVLQLLALLLPLLNAIADPQPIQQGRYLLPVLGPLALTLAVGYLALAAPGRYTGWVAAGWVALWLSFALAALACLLVNYA